MSDRAWLLMSHSTWGEYRYVNGVFENEEEARYAASEFPEGMKEGDSSFGWTLTAVPLNRFDSVGVGV